MPAVFEPLRIPATANPRYRAGEVGAEARCVRCGEWWPADTEFFRARLQGTPSSWCKGCEHDAKRQPRTPSPAATGINEEEMK